jgi:hypothetical protein
MFARHTEEPVMTAVELRAQLRQLETERAMALHGVAQIDADTPDLDEEIEVIRRIYVAYAVTEVATLRGELFGPQTG